MACVRDTLGDFNRALFWLEQGAASAAAGGAGGSARAAGARDVDSASTPFLKKFLTSCNVGVSLMIERESDLNPAAEDALARDGGEQRWDALLAQQLQPQQPAAVAPLPQMTPQQRLLVLDAMSAVKLRCYECNAAALSTHHVATAAWQAAFWAAADERVIAWRGSAV